MFERFTDRSRRVLVLAQEEARALGHTFIGTEHILLGLLSEARGLAARALEESGVTLSSAREAVRAMTGQGNGSPGAPPFTPQAKKVLECSLRESLQRGDEEIGTEHLLLGLLREGQGLGCHALVSEGVDLQELRGRVVVLANGAPRLPRGEPRRRKRERRSGSSPSERCRTAEGHRRDCDASTRDVLSAYRRNLAALLHRFDVAPASAPVGDYVELLVASALGARLELAPGQGRDLVVDGRRARVRASIAPTAERQATIQTVLSSPTSPPPSPSSPLPLSPLPDVSPPARAGPDDVVIVLLSAQDLTVVRAVVVATTTLAAGTDRFEERRPAPDALDAGRNITEVLRSFE